MRVIRLGDRTSHGGEVITAASNYEIMGKKVAREHDTVTCPIPGHRSGGIIGGDRLWTINGRAVALQGPSKAPCGAEIFSSCGELDRTFEGEGTAGLGLDAYPANQYVESVRENVEQLAYDEHFVLIDDRTGKPVQNFEFYVAGQSQTAQTGVTNADGRTSLIQSDTPEKATLKARQTEIMIG